MVRSLLPHYRSRYARLLPRLERLHQDLTRTKGAEYDHSTIVRVLPRPSWSAWGEVVGRALSGPWAIGTLLAITTVNSNYVTPAILIAAAAYLTAALCYMELDTLPSSPSLYNTIFRRAGEFPAFVAGWASVLANMALLAACSRGLSNLVDAAIGGRLSKLGVSIFGHESPIGYYMDYAAFGVAALPTILCACGMEVSGGDYQHDTDGNDIVTLQEVPLLRVALNFGVALTTVFLAVATLLGHQQPVDETSLPISDENPTEKLLLGSALCCISYYGVSSVGGEARKYCRSERLIQLAGAIALLIIFLSNFAIGSVLAVSGPRHITSSSIEVPLILLLLGTHDWLQLVASILTIACLGVSLLETSHPLHAAVQALAHDGLLRRELTKENARTGTPVAAILGFGFLAASLALLLNVEMLLALAASAVVVLNALMCTLVLHQRYQVPAPSPSRRIRRPPRLPSKEEHKEHVVCYLKHEFGSHLPQAIATAAAAAAAADSCQETSSRISDVQVHADSECGSDRKASTASASTASTCPCTASLGAIGECSSRDTVDKPLSSIAGSEPSLELDLLSLEARPSREPPCPTRLPVLLDESPTDYQHRDKNRLLEGHSSSDSDSYLDDDDTSSSGVLGIDSETDIDAAVAEYQEKLRVATLMASGEQGAPGTYPVVNPTPATARRVSLAVIALLLCAATFGLAAAHVPHHTASVMTLLLTVALVSFLLLAVIVRQPQWTPPPPRVSLLTSAPAPTPYRIPLCPWLPAIALFLHTWILLHGLRHSSLYAAAWWGTGLLLYFSYSIHHSIAADHRNFKSNSPRQHTVVSTLSCSGHRRFRRSRETQRLTQVDTILVGR